MDRGTFFIEGNCLDLITVFASRDAVDTFLRAVVRWLAAYSQCDRNKLLRWIDHEDGCLGVGDETVYHNGRHVILCGFPPIRARVTPLAVTCSLKFCTVYWTLEERMDLLRAFGSTMQYLTPVRVFANVTTSFASPPYVVRIEVEIPPGASPEIVPHMLEVQKYVEKDGYRHVGYMKQLFCNAIEPCEYYDAAMIRHGTKLRKLNELGTLCSDHDPVTKLRYCVRPFNHEVRTVDSFL